MDIIRVTYSGRITAGKLKRFELPPKAPGLTEEQKYRALQLQNFGLEAMMENREALDLPNLSNLHEASEPSQSRRRGAKGITSHGRSLVRDAALWLQEKYGRQHLSFLTLTIPPECLVPVVVQQWSDLTRKLRQRLQRLLLSRGLPPQLVGVVEIQEKRGRSASGLPPLHWHFVFCGRNKYESWKITPVEVKELWLDLLHAHTGVRSDAHSSVDIRRVEKDAAGYLGKYMSKGSKSCSEYDIDVLPASWYLCTTELRKTVKKLEVYFTGKAAELFYDAVQMGAVALKFSKLVTLISDAGASIHVGWYGEVASREDYWKVLMLAADCRDMVA